MAQVEENYTEVSTFIIVGFPGLQLEYFHMMAWFLFILYVTTVVGNLVLVVIFALEHSLQKPMYIIMVSLALSDIGFTTVALPKLIARYWWNDASIGFYTCHFQRHMIHYFGSLNSLIMLTMAVDRYLAVIFPLRYPMLMSAPTMTILTVFSWLVAHVFPSTTSYVLTQISFCRSDQIIQAFCDTISLTALACGDKSYISSASYISAMFILLVPLGFVIYSYFCIIISVFHMTSGQGRRKTLSTCATQGCIISIYYVPRFFVYSSSKIPNINMTPGSQIATTFFYSFFPPVINPFVYCLRTKEIQAILSRWVQRLQVFQRKSNKTATVPKVT
ncbi:odorant receptor 104-1 [Poeciliopsis prolifica]|uniref:odorant receptor 104-1 n=1 Tax=Poeciliopsis prolifica TaxID=188132 RepID=UPI002413237B|nr:odorant receptor 104-1 [Poeciliopsis prolifica]